MSDGWQVVWEPGAILGEGTLWDPRDACVWWVDIKRPAIHWLPLGGDPRGSWTPPCRIGALAPRAAGGFVAATEHGFALVDPKAGTFQPLGNPEEDRPDNRFNDGALDLSGRFWAGTMDDAEKEATGALYRLDAIGDWSRCDDGYKVTNGPAFSPDGGTLYHNDSGRQLTYAFDLDGAGGIASRRILIRHTDGSPDGMTVDSDGDLWIAIWDGWEVRRFSPDGRQVEARRLPVARPTRPAFGGPALDRLFVSSASDEVDTAEQPLAGALFEIDEPGAAGFVVPPFAG